MPEKIKFSPRQERVPAHHEGHDQAGHAVQKTKKEKIVLNKFGNRIKNNISKTGGFSFFKKRLGAQRAIKIYLF